MLSKILVSHESPIDILEQSRSYNEFDYCLVHLLETHPKYAEFFKVSKTLNREILLDNSIFELGVAFDGDKFAKYVEEIEPTYYIIPDVLEDGYATIKSFSDFTAKYPNLKGLKIGAIQGKTYDEISNCYKYMSYYADYIAISFDFSYYVATGKGDTKLERWCDGRKKLIDRLIADGLWNWSKPHHLLGNSLPQEMKYYVKFNIHNIRSVDTSNPIVAGIKGIKYSGDLGLKDKPSVKLADLIDTKITSDQWELIQYNVSQYKKILCR